MMVLSLDVNMLYITDVSGFKTLATRILPCVRLL